MVAESHGFINGWQLTDVIKRVSWDASGRRLASLTLSGIIQVFDLQSSPVEAHCRTQVARWCPDPEHCEAVSLAFDVSGQRLAVGLYGGWARIFNVEEEVELVRLQFDVAAWCFAWHPSGRQLAIGDGLSANVFDTECWDAIAKGTFGDFCVDLSWNSQGTWLAGAISDGTARVCEFGTWEEVGHWSHEGPVVAIAWERAGKLLASASRDWSVRIFDVDQDVEVFRSLHAGPVFSIAWHPSGKYLASCGRDKTARIFDAVGKTEVARLEHADLVTDIRWHPSGHWLAAIVRGRFSLGDDGIPAAVHVYGTRLNWTEVACFTHNDTTLTSFTWAPTLPFSAQLATGGGDKTVRVFDLSKHVRACNWPRGRALWQAYRRGQSGSYIGKLTPEVLRRICSYLVLPMWYTVS